ncbi:MAG: 30S ribosomal protein S3 [Gloeomargarita sp. SKYG116]|nr:30S ribosomal protein S3 [Gloeomargarita sp. SKYG116]MDW8401877.1 30S ribosomal protein S3 [Gloeomargarita sp. SKYGB_i_bin116]
MGQKTHPVGFRLGITREHLSRWFAPYRQYPELLQEDHRIRQFIMKKLAKAAIARVYIQRKADQIELAIHTGRPGVVVGQRGSGIEALRKELEQYLGRQQVKIRVVEINKVDAEAPLLADYIVEQLEKRVAFRRAVKQAVQRAQRAEVQGIKVMVSGRLNGAEIARSEWVREGRVPLQTLRADIDYAYRTAQTVYGVLGVKVWVFRGEIMPKPQQEAVPVRAGKPVRPPRRRQQFEDRSEAEVQE